MQDVEYPINGSSRKKEKRNREEEIIKQEDETFPHSLSAAERAPRVPDT